MPPRTVVNGAAKVALKSLGSNGSILLSCQLPLRTTFAHKSRHSDVRIWPARRIPSVLILFICGNPGLIDYYTEFLSTIHGTSPDTYEIIGVGHEGHSTEQPLPLLEAFNRPRAFHTRRLPTLQDQIDRKIAYLDEIKASYPQDSKVVLIGHSVGAYICQEVFKARPHAVHAMYGLFPSLAHIATTPNGLRLSPLFSNPAIIMVVSFLTVLNTVLPFYILHWIVRIATRQERPASTVTANLVHNPSVVACALAMAGDEMKTILEPDTAFLKQFGHKVTLYFAAGSSDGWVGDEARVKRLTDALDSSKSEEGEGRARWHICERNMPHAFCLEHSNAMAHLCAEWVADDLRVE